MAKDPYELCILFLHHRDDAVTRLHMDMLVRSNPFALIVPIVDAPESALPLSVDVSQLPTPWNTTNKWRSCDTMIYRWFANRTCDAKRYVVLEYDCWCDVDLVEFYAEYADAEVVTAHYEGGEKPWPWFGERDRLGPEDRPFAAGVWPIAGTMFTHAALEQVCAVASREDVYCELRLGTAIARSALRVRTLEGRKQKRIDYLEYPLPIVRPGFYHAVKGVDHNRTRLAHTLRFIVSRVLRRTLKRETRAAMLSVLERSETMRQFIRPKRA